MMQTTEQLAVFDKALIQREQMLGWQCTTVTQGVHYSNRAVHIASTRSVAWNAGKEDMQPRTDFADQEHTMEQLQETVRSIE